MDKNPGDRQDRSGVVEEDFSGVSKRSEATAQLMMSCNTRNKRERGTEVSKERKECVDNQQFWGTRTGSGLEPFRLQLNRNWARPRTLGRLNPNSIRRPAGLFFSSQSSTESY